MGFGKDGKGVIIRESKSQDVGTLAFGAALFVTTALPTLERFRMLKTELIATVISVTTGELNGLFLGLADGDLTLPEIEASIEQNGPVGPNDTVANEVALRPIWWLGATDRETGSELVFENERGGHMMEATPRWTFARTKGWNLFIYNLGAAPTTGATVKVRQKSFGVWVT